MLNTEKHTPVYAVRRFTPYRGDGHCFELYEVATGECASFPDTRKSLEKYAKQKNLEARQAQVQA